MPANIDMLGARAKLGKTCELQRAGVVLEDLAVNIGFLAKYWEALGANFSNEFHGWDDVSERHGKHNVLQFSC